MLTINIKTQLDKSGMNKNQFSKESKIGYPAVCKLYEGTTTSIKFDTLEAICITLNCTPNDIITSDDPQMQRLLTYSSMIHELNNKIKSDT